MPIMSFTGTRKQITPEQQDKLLHVIREIMPDDVHHGDCLGADALFHDLCKQQGTIRILIHPPDVVSARAFCDGHFSFPPKPYLERNWDIVDASDILVAVPETAKEKQRSGTWATIRYARKMGKAVIIILPDGKIL